VYASPRMFVRTRYGVKANLHNFSLSSRTVHLNRTLSAKTFERWTRISEIAMIPKHSCGNLISRYSRAKLAYGLFAFVRRITTNDPTNEEETEHGTRTVDVSFHADPASKESPALLAYVHTCI